mgnify:FL=1
MVQKLWSIVEIQNGRRLPSWILIFFSFWQYGPLPLVIVYVYTKFEVFGSNGSKVMPIVEIQDGRGPPSSILRFCYFWPYGPIPLVIVYVHTKFEVSSSNG